MATAGVTTREWTAGRTLWFTVVLLGWFVLGYLAVSTPGGLYDTAAWISTLSPAYQLLMWLLLLPYMMAIWVWTSTWDLWLRLAAVGSLFVLTLLLARPAPRYRA